MSEVHGHDVAVQFNLQLKCIHHEQPRTPDDGMMGTLAALNFPPSFSSCCNTSFNSICRLTSKTMLLFVFCTSVSVCTAQMDEVHKIFLYFHTHHIDILIYSA